MYFKWIERNVRVDTSTENTRKFEKSIKLSKHSTRKKVCVHPLKFVITLKTKKHEMQEERRLSRRRRRIKTK